MRNFLLIFFDWVGVFFVLYMVGYASFLFLSVTVGSSELYGAKRRNLLKNELLNDYYVPVSILVPAHNEEITIEATIRSLLALHYRLYEIIVVDDGSTGPSSGRSPARRPRPSLRPGPARSPSPSSASATAARPTP